MRLFHKTHPALAFFQVVTKFVLKQVLSGLIDQLKAVGESALKSGVARKGDQKPRPPPKPSADEIRMERNADAILKTFEVIDEGRYFDILLMITSSCRTSCSVILIEIRQIL